MTPAERLAEARGMAILAAELQARGILTASGEMLWGAVNHIINAIAEHHGLVMASGAPMSRRLVMEHLQQADPREPHCRTAWLWSVSCTATSTTSI